MLRRMRHLEREAKHVVDISISTKCYSFYLTLKTMTRTVIYILKEMNVKRMLTVGKKKERNGLDIFGKRSETKFPSRRHYSRFYDRKKGRFKCR
jgi:hypothetical protein